MLSENLNMFKLKSLYIQVSFSFSFLFSNGPFLFDSLTEQDGLRNGPDYSEALLYYPLDAISPLPVVILVPGFTNSISAIDDWGTYLASYGYATFLVNVNSFFEPPSSRAAAMLDAIVTIRLENERLGSPLFQSLNINDFTVGGYSMGGGGAQIAAQQDSSIKSVIALAAWLDNPSITVNNNTPVIFISGELDNVAPNDYHTNVFYNNTPGTTDKLLYEISGAFHSTVTSPYNDQEMGLKIIFWIEKYILIDFDNCDSLITQPSTASEFFTNVECPIISTGDITQDGITNVLDLILLISWVMYGNNLSDLEMSLSDLINDGVLDIFDIIFLADMI